MDEGYEVTSADLTTHSANLARITAKLDAALAAANAQSIPTDAFGIICQQVPNWFVAPLHDRGVTAVGNGIARAEEIRKLVTATAQDYDAREASNASALREVHP